jgi:hypothetical protein
MFAALNSFQVGGKPMLVSDVFSTTLYTGNGASQSITNGINLSANDGLVWLKNRQSANGHWLSDTARGINKYLQSQNTDAEGSLANSFTAFNTNGFSIGSNGPNNPSESYVSWTFREQPLFFDVVTYTGNGTTQNIAHSLGSVPGCIIVKRTDGNADWQVYHRSLANTQFLLLNQADGVATGTYWNNTTPTSSVFSVGTDSSVNASGSPYVAYLFAHDAGGFGSGADNAISCGSYSGASGTVNVNIGYEPQFILKKKVSGSGNWIICDKTRGMPSGSTAKVLCANTSSAETSAFDADGYIYATSTGFSDDNSTSGQTYIYVAIKAS